MSSTQPLPIAVKPQTRLSPPLHQDRPNTTTDPDDTGHSPRSKVSSLETHRIHPILDQQIAAPTTDLVDEGIDCPRAFLPRPRQASQILLDVFHHPAELNTPPAEEHAFAMKDPFSLDGASGGEARTSPPRISPDAGPFSPSAFFEATRSPVLAIHHSRPAVGSAVGHVSSAPDEDDTQQVTRTISGLSLDPHHAPPTPADGEPTAQQHNGGFDTARRKSSMTVSETTYVPLTPLPGNCILSFLDRPREMSKIMAHNAELFTLIEHAHPQKYPELLELWKEPREVVSDGEWVARTRAVIAMDEEDAGALWARWKEIVGYESDEEDEDEDGDEVWTFHPSDTTLHRRWGEFERVRQEAEQFAQSPSSGGVSAGMPSTPPSSRGVPGGESSGGSGIGLSGISGIGTGLTGIQENEEEEEYDDGERPIHIGMKSTGK